MYSPRSMSTVTSSSARVSAASPAESPLNDLTIPSSRMRGMFGSTGAASSVAALLLRFHQAISPPPCIGRTSSTERWHIRSPAGKRGGPFPRITRDNIRFSPLRHGQKGSLMTPRRFLPALLLLFVGSGCAALIYEVVWFQLLQLVIGSSRGG